METKFNFKSQICTDKIQSKRLLSLGLKKETADCGIYYSELAGCDRMFAKIETEFEADDIPAWSLWRLIEMLPPSIKDGYHYSLIYDIHRDAIGYICFANGGLQRQYNRLLWDTQSTNPFDNIIVCIEWLIKEGYFPKEYLDGTTEN